MSEREQAFIYWLYSVPGIGRENAKRLLEMFDSAETAYRHPERAAKLLTEKRREGFLAFTRSFSPQSAWEELMQRGIRFTALPLPDYPKKLKEIADAPFGITWLGQLPEEGRPAVSVIGARACSEYGRVTAKRFGAELAAAGIQVVSGMAVGIDGLSQAAAVQAGGKSFAVLGSGVDICYPEENRALYEKLIKTGGVISEYPPGTLPRGNLFPPRNRLISAFCDILLVIEARQRSGTLITVDMALEQGKDIFAVPGRITDALSDGCNQLIRQGAGIATGTSDITEQFYGSERLPVSALRTQKGDSGTSRIRTELLTGDEQLVAAHLDIRPKSAAEIVSELENAGTPRAVPRIMETLVGLCIKGVAVQTGGSFMVRCPS